LSYDILFKKYYDDNVRGFLEKVNFGTPTKPVSDAGKLGNTPIVTAPAPGGAPTAPAAVTAPVVTTTPVVPDLPVAAPVTPLSTTPTDDAAQLREKLRANPSVEPDIKYRVSPTPPVEPAEKIRVADTHKNFINSLESLSNESPLLLSSYIKKYAKSIQFSDVETSIRLLKIAQNIKG
jgi:hypothetical protein